MISSTARDLPNHRLEAAAACQIAGVFPEQMMENLTAENANAVEVSMRLVQKADLYIGIFAYRYGYVPEDDNPNSISITEMEYRKAVERDIPRLLFLIHESHDVKGPDVEKGEGALKLEKLKEEITKEHVVKYFESASDLRAKLGEALMKYSKRESESGKSAKRKKKYSRRLTSDVEFFEGITLKDLDNNILNEYLESERVKEELEKKGHSSSSISKKLEAQFLIKDNYITTGAYLCFNVKKLFATKHGCCILRCVKYSHKTKAESQVEEVEYFDNLVSLFHKGMKWIQEQSGLRRVGTPGSRSRDDWEIPKLAVREALANALAHRKYSGKAQDQPTLIEIFLDRIEITSFGKLIKGIDISTLNENPEKIKPLRRNPIITDIFQSLTIVELKASGVARIFRLAKNAGLPSPIITAEANTVTAILYRNPRNLDVGKEEFFKEVDKAFISSTIKDLPDYRVQVIGACQRMGIFPLVVEHLPALGSAAIDLSLDLIDQADIFIGIYAYRYGHVPDGHEISISEIEYNRAVELGIPRLIFIIRDDVPVLPNDFDKGKAAEQLETLKEKLKKEKVVAFFMSPEDLRGLVIHSLGDLKKEFQGNKGNKYQGEDLANSLHSTFEIPIKPRAFVAHPYTLLQVKGLIGRKRELEILTDWVNKPTAITIFNIVAIGGMGKSALTWTWFNDIAPQEKKWAGRVWWSFYETDATFDNFITSTLAYVSGKPVEALNVPAEQKQTKLLQALDNHPYLIVLDGLERILVAYASQGAAFLDDDSALDDRTANRIAGTYGLPESSSKSFIGRHRLRKTTDARIGHFLRKLSQVRKSKILVSTRLYPADLQTFNGQPYPRCSALFLPGLSNQDALELWRASGAKGSRQEMLPVFQSFDKHPLLLQLLAAEVAEFRAAPGDFDAWRKANSGFNVFGLPLVQVQSHVLSYALRGLSLEELRTLQVIAGFRMPASMLTLKALLLEGVEKENNPIFSSESALDQALTTLEDKGLLGWDRRSNRYDLHPIVRGVVWNNLDANKQLEIHGAYKSHFEAMPTIEYMQVEGIEDLRPAIELYNALVEMKLYNEAYLVFFDKLHKATLYRLSANNLRIELLERLFVEGTDQLPALSSKEDQAWTIGALALGYEFSGLPSKAIPLFQREIEIYSTSNNLEYLAIGLANLSNSFRSSMKFIRAELVAKKGLILGREIKKYYPEILNLDNLGRILAYRGAYDDAKKALKLEIKLAINKGIKQNEGLSKAFLCQILLLAGENQLAKELADEAWELATYERLERDFIRAAYCQGLTALRLNDLNKAEERLHFALKRVRAIQVVEEEIQILIALAEFYLQQNELEKAREQLDDIWDYAEQGPYPILHADALNILAQIEIEAGNKQTATKAATEAFQKAWCDGPPYAYHYGLQQAKRLLKELGAEEPKMPPFDASKFEPMPEVEIVPLKKEE